MRGSRCWGGKRRLSGLGRAAARWLERRNGGAECKSRCHGMRLRHGNAVLWCKKLGAKRAKPAALTPAHFPVVSNRNWAVIGRTPPSRRCAHCLLSPWAELERHSRMSNRLRLTGNRTQRQQQRQQQHQPAGAAAAAAARNSGGLQPKSVACRPPAAERMHSSCTSSSSASSSRAASKRRYCHWPCQPSAPWRQTR